MDGRWTCTHACLLTSYPWSYPYAQIFCLRFVDGVTCLVLLCMRRFLSLHVYTYESLMHMRIDLTFAVQAYRCIIDREMHSEPYTAAGFLDVLTTCRS